MAHLRSSLKINPYWNVMNFHDIDLTSVRLVLILNWLQLNLFVSSELMFVAPHVFPSLWGFFFELNYRVKVEVWLLPELYLLFKLGIDDLELRDFVHLSLHMDSFFGCSSHLLSIEFHVPNTVCLLDMFKGCKLLTGLHSISNHEL